MPDWMDGFDALIAPHSVDDFFATTWERAPLHLRHGADFVDGLFDLDDIDELLTGAALRHPSFRIVKDGAEAHPDAYTHRSMPWGRGTVSGYIDYDKTLALIRGGGSLVLDQVHRIHPPLAELTRSVELAMGAAARADATMTPAGARALVPHYDVQDVFVVQTAGHKHWQVHAPHVALPVAGQDCPPQGVEPGELLLDVVLEPGDVLYLPRGFVRVATALDRTSLHASICTAPRTHLDLLHELVDAARDDVRLRRGLRLDLHGPADSTDEEQAELARVLQDLSRIADLDGLLDRLARKLADTRMPLLAGALADHARVGELTLDSLLVLREGMVWRAESLGDEVRLSFHGKQVRMPWHAIQTARFIGEAGPFRVREVPGELDDAQRLDLCRSLVEEGLLSFAD